MLRYNIKIDHIADLTLYTIEQRFAITVLRIKSVKIPIFYEDLYVYLQMMSEKCQNKQWTIIADVSTWISTFMVSIVLIGWTTINLFDVLKY